jgi:Cupin domain
MKPASTAGAAIPVGPSGVPWVFPCGRKLRTGTGVATGSRRGQNGAMSNSPYLFRAADHPLLDANEHLKVREAVSGFGIALRYQERAPDAPGAPEGGWCETGHSIFILSGRIRYRFDDHVVEAGPGDMLHIPAGRKHRHKPSVAGAETVRYVLTEFG